MSLFFLSRLSSLIKIKEILSCLSCLNSNSSLSCFYPIILYFFLFNLILTILYLDYLFSLVTSKLNSLVLHLHFPYHPVPVQSFLLEVFCPLFFIFFIFFLPSVLELKVKLNKQLHNHSNLQLNLANDKSHGRKSFQISTIFETCWFFTHQLGQYKELNSEKLINKIWVSLISWVPTVRFHFFVLSGMNFHFISFFLKWRGDYFSLLWLFDQPQSIIAMLLFTKFSKLADLLSRILGCIKFKKSTIINQSIIKKGGFLKTFQLHNETLQISYISVQILFISIYLVWYHCSMASSQCDLPSPGSAKDIYSYIATFAILKPSFRAILQSLEEFLFRNSQHHHKLFSSSLLQGGTYDLQGEFFQTLETIKYHLWDREKVVMECYLQCKKKLTQLPAVDMQKVPGRFCCYSKLSPRVIQPSFDAQLLCQTISICKQVEFGWQLGWSMLHVNCRKLSNFFFAVLPLNVMKNTFHDWKQQEDKSISLSSRECPMGELLSVIWCEPSPHRLTLILCLYLDSRDHSLLSRDLALLSRLQLNLPSY
ncbi:hypothetical protein VP01_2169g3 [Puccinia sorghi]|uniref:Uncharacterized protein n=1 Tax=Puccinia sorghi TaxID=27349 RepID=A0A0L6VBB6_9BASI|nr:hypothetical protein VP01_2169g3 [Puccinia sorghi]